MNGHPDADTLKAALDRLYFGPEGRNDEDRATLLAAIGELTHLREQEEEVTHLRQWVDDLQSGMYINCVYCGHRYGPRQHFPAAVTAVTEANQTMMDALREHVTTCPKHPMSELRASLEAVDHILANFPAPSRVESIYAIREQGLREGHEQGLQDAVRRIKAVIPDSWDTVPVRDAISAIMHPERL